MSVGVIDVGVSSLGCDVHGLIAWEEEEYPHAARLVSGCFCVYNNCRVCTGGSALCVREWEIDSERYMHGPLNSYEAGNREVARSLHVRKF